jgi:hypothetical protein
MAKANDTIKLLNTALKDGVCPLQHVEDAQSHIGGKIMSPDQLGRLDSASSAVTEKGKGREEPKKTYVTERVIHQKDDINKFFQEKGQQLEQIT